MPVSKEQINTEAKEIFKKSIFFLLYLSLLISECKEEEEEEEEEAEYLIGGWRQS